MKSAVQLLAVSCTVLAALCLYGQGRRDVVINEAWQFNGANIKGETVSEVVDLPHTWNAEDGPAGFTYYRGLGIYTKHLLLEKTDQNRRIFLLFEGANTVTDVYVNEGHAGLHKGGYAAFVFEITDLVYFGSENKIEVKVDNSHSDDIMPLSGDFNIYGGIYRPVHLLVTDKACITPLDYGSPGVYLKQKNVTKSGATVEIISKLSNGYENARDLSVRAVVRDAQGEKVAEIKTDFSVASGETKTNVQELILNEPHLWNGREDPYLYQVTVDLMSGNEVIDTVEQPLGLRYFRVDPEDGFYLNDEHIKLQGVSRHNDFAGKGAALTEAEHDIDMQLILEMGSNSVRLAHYQHAQYFYDLCDKEGLVVWAEIPYVGSLTSGYTDSDAFRENGKQQLIELIRQNYNHTSIVFWGLYNEIRTPEEGNPIQFVKDLDKLAREEDPTRLTTAASFLDDNEINAVPQTIAWNKYFGWYYGWPDGLGDWVDEIHAKNPQFCIGISEYGAGGSIYHHEENLKRPFPFGHFWHPEEWQNLYHEGNWKVISERPFIWGSYVWNMFDFSANFRREGDAIGMNDKGLITYDRKTRKDAYYFYKANWNETPLVYITGRRFKERKSDQVDVKVYANLDEIELFVNDVSKGRKKGTYATFSWEDVDLTKGNNVIKAVGSKDGEQYSDTIVWAYDDFGALALVVKFLRIWIKPVTALSIILVLVLFVLGFRRKTAGWKRVASKILFFLFLIYVLAIIGLVIFAGRFNANPFDYSII